MRTDRETTGDDRVEREKATEKRECLQFCPCGFIPVCLPVYGEEQLSVTCLMGG